MLKVKRLLRVLLLALIILCYSVPQVFADTEYHYDYYPVPNISVTYFDGSTLKISLPSYEEVTNGAEIYADGEYTRVSLVDGYGNSLSATGEEVSWRHGATWTYTNLNPNRTYYLDGYYYFKHSNQSGTDYYYTEHKYILIGGNITPSFSITPLNWDTIRGRGKININWNNDPIFDNYYVEFYNGYKWETFDTTTRNTWDSSIEKIYPSEDKLNSFADNSQNTIFDHSNGGVDLADNPNKIYVKTTGTSSDSYTKYKIRISGYKSGCFLYSNEYEVSLPNRTDTVAPTGSVAINNGASATKSTTVTLNLSATDTGGSGIAKMRFSNDNSVWSAWETYSTTKSWVLVSGSGTKTVYAQFLDVAGNTSLVYTDDIVVDSTLPTGSITINDGDPYATNRNLSLYLPASDNMQVSQMKFKVDSGSWGSPVSYTSPYTLTITAQNGTRTVYVIFIDSAGNESGVYSDSIVLDESAPVINSFSINGGASWAGAGGVTLNIGASDAGTGLKDVQFSNDNSIWSAWETYTGIKYNWLLTASSGQKTVYVRVRDIAGNISSVASDTINVDDIKPVVSSVLINDGVARTGSTEVNIKITASDSGGSGLSKYQISNDNSVWNDYAIVSEIDDFVIPAGAGQKDVYVRAVDGAGNISDVYKVSIYLKDDNDAPKASLVINNGDELTTSTSVTLVINAYDDLTPIEQLKMRFSNDGSNWSSWESIAFTKNWTINSVKGIERVFMQVMDSVGNIATAGDTIAYYSSAQEYKEATSGTQVDTEAPETSAIGRALGFMGYGLLGTGIASADEIKYSYDESPINGNDVGESSTASGTHSSVTTNSSTGMEHFSGPVYFRRIEYSGNSNKGKPYKRYQGYVADTGETLSFAVQGANVEIETNKRYIISGMRDKNMVIIKSIKEDTAA